MAEKFVLISALDELKKGQQFVDWPLHVTIVPWFSLPTERALTFENALTNRLQEVAPIVAVGAEEAMFGADKTVRVRTVRSLGALASLHKLALELVRTFDGDIDEAYVADDYVPHVTYQGEQGIAKDQTFSLNAMQLIRGDSVGPRSVERVFYFGSRNK